MPNGPISGISMTAANHRGFPLRGASQSATAAQIMPTMNSGIIEMRKDGSVSGVIRNYPRKVAGKHDIAMVNASSRWNW
jgi:hypothetical protein